MTRRLVCRCAPTTVGYQALRPTTATDDLDNDHEGLPAGTLAEAPASDRGIAPQSPLSPLPDVLASDADLLTLLLDETGVAEPDLVAGRLLAATGGLTAMGACSARTLMTRYDLSPRAARRTAAAFELGRRARIELVAERPCVRTNIQAAALFLPVLSELDQEQVRVLLLDNRLGLMANVMVYQGTIDTCVIREAEVLRDAVRINARSLIVGHNHPSGDVTPSPEDLAITRSLVDAGRLLGIDVLDHLIVGRGAHLSLREQRLVAGCW